MMVEPLTGDRRRGRAGCAEILVEIAVLKTEVKQLSEEQAEMRKDIAEMKPQLAALDQMKADVRDTRTQINKWRGGLPIIIGLLTFAGGLIGSWEIARSFFMGR